ncbi:MAG: hypothetical protein IAG10_27430 [Planctomycetaceae bacterium]|nr:hypothetical protein [Planctomycetaceae bacterium]
MSDTAKKLFDGLRAMGQGLQSNLLEGPAQGKAELSRLGTQGTMELASALFSGNGFVPYGPGQYTPAHEHQQEHDRGIER